MACFCFSVITFKCDNPIQMFITIFALWWLVFLSGFYGICFFPLFKTFFVRERESRPLAVSFLRHSCLCCPSTRYTLYFSPTPAHPALQSHRHCLLNYEVPSHSLTHSVTHIKLPPRCPLCLSPCPPNAISLQA